MATIERKEKCSSCKWEGKVVVENTKPQTPMQELTSLIGVGLRSGKCPKCGANTVPSTRQMAS